MQGGWLSCLTPSMPCFRSYMQSSRRRREPRRTSKPASAAAADSRDQRDRRAFRWWIVIVFCVVLLMTLAMLVPRYPIHDCDEVFNFWEPLALKVLGRRDAFKTWEYDASFALRPWLYVELHRLLLSPVVALVGSSDPVLLFLALRMLLGLVSVGCLALVVRRVLDVAGTLPAVATALLSWPAASPGMGHALFAFLPSSVCMQGMCLVIAGLLHDDLAARIVGSCASVVLAWPFSVLAFVPAALLTAAEQAKKHRLLFSCSIFAAASLALCGAIAVNDYVGYGRWTFSVWNIVFYNVFGSGGAGTSSALYGVEDSLFYIRNLVLNFGPVSVASACASPLVLVVAPEWRPSRRVFATAAVAPLFLWLSFHCTIPHKEERFMYPVYPCLIVCAAITFSSVMRRSRLLGTLLTLLTLLFGCLRLATQVENYGAPLRLYRDFFSAFRQSSGVLCLGDEWHRFPSTFFLPSDVRTEFIRDGFLGQLPAHFDSVAPHFNPFNRAEEDRFVDAERCDFLIDVRVRQANVQLPKAYDALPWRVAATYDFLEQSQCPSVVDRALLGAVRRSCPRSTYRLLVRTRPSAGV